MKKKTAKTSKQLQNFANNTITKSQAKKVKGGIVVEDWVML